MKPFFIPGHQMCDEGRTLSLLTPTNPPPYTTLWLIPNHTPHPQPIRITLTPQPTLDYPAISIDFPIMRLFIFGLLTEWEEELIKQIAIISWRTFCCVLCCFSMFSFFLHIFCVVFQRRHIFWRKVCQYFTCFDWLRHLLVLVDSLLGDLGGGVRE